MAQRISKAEYNRNVKRIKQFIRRAEKRGYVFPEIKLPKGKKIRELTPEKLYKKAVYGGEATFGEVVPAEEGLKAERSAISKKSAQTRAEKKEAERRFFSGEQTGKSSPEYLPIKENITISNFIDGLIEKLQEPSEEYYYFSTRKGKQIKHKDRIAVIRSDRKKYLLGLLYREINSIGKEGVANRLESKQDEISDLINVINADSDSNVVYQASTRVASFITDGDYQKIMFADLDTMDDENDII